MVSRSHSDRSSNAGNSWIVRVCARRLNIRSNSSIRSVMRSAPRPASPSSVSPSSRYRSIRPEIPLPLEMRMLIALACLAPKMADEMERPFCVSPISMNLSEIAFNCSTGPRSRRSRTLSPRSSKALRASPVARAASPTARPRRSSTFSTLSRPERCATKSSSWYSLSVMPRRSADFCALSSSAATDLIPLKSAAAARKAPSAPAPTTTVAASPRIPS